MTAALPPSVDPYVSASLASVEVAVTTAIHPIVESAAAIAVTDNASFHVADSFRGRVTDGLLLVDAHLDPIINPQYEALQNMYALRRRLKLPLEQALKLIDGQMCAWNLKEKARIAEEQRVREEQARQEQERLAAQEQKERAEHAERVRIATQYAQPAPPPYVPPPPAIVTHTTAMPIMPAARGAHSSARAKWTWTFDLATVLVAILDGTIPLDRDGESPIQMNDKMINVLVKSKEGRKVLAAWPGITVVEDVTIARKGGGGA